MTKKIEDGGPAFPVLGNIGYNSDWVSEDGMSLRDHFASQAIPAIIRQCASNLNFMDKTETAEQYFARKAYLIADAMLLARKSGGEA